MNRHQETEHEQGASAANARARPVRLGHGQDVLIVRSPLQRRLLEVLPTAEWRPHFTGLARELKKSPSSVWDAYKALQKQGLYAEVTLTIVVSISLLLAFGSLLAEPGPVRVRWAVPAGLVIVLMTAVLIVAPPGNVKV